MNIGKAAARSGLQTTTIRYYEQIGLIKSTRRENGYRDYSEDDVNQLRFVHQARNLGFDIEDCRKLLQLYSDPNRASASVKEVAEEHLTAVDKKIAELRSHAPLAFEARRSLQGRRRSRLPDYRNTGRQSGRTLDDAAQRGLQSCANPASKRSASPGWSAASAAATRRL